MIAALRGSLQHWDEHGSTLLLDVAGVTYEVLLPAFAHEWVAVHRPGEELRVFTYYHVTERSPTPVLIGFPHSAERDFFRKFIEVPDVGPAKAVRALTRPVSEIARWVETEDVVALKQLPGIGERLAQTIVARLHGKLLQEALLRDESVEAVDGAPQADLRQDAIEALTALQYSRRGAEQVVNDILLEQPRPVSLEALLRAVLERQVPAR
jgi:Holliday junction DNA helicase RuvA